MKHSRTGNQGSRGNRRGRLIAWAMCPLLLGPCGVFAAGPLSASDEARAIHQLQTASVQERIDAADQLGQAGSDKAIAALVASLNDILARDAASAALGRIGERATEPLLAATKHTNPRVRQASVEILGRVASREAVPRLEEMLSDQDTSVRRAVHVALGQIQGQTSSAILARIFEEDRDYTTKRYAARALLYAAQREELPILHKALRHPHPPIKRHIAQALGHLGDPSSVEPLLTAMHKETHSSVRASAAQALAEIGNEQAIAGLSAALDDKVEMAVRIEAAAALGKAGNPAAVPALKKVLKADDYDLRICAARSLGQIGGPQAIEALQWARDHTNPDMAHMIAHALDLATRE